MAEKKIELWLELIFIAFDFIFIRLIDIEITKVDGVYSGVRPVLVDSLS